MLNATSVSFTYLGADTLSLRDVSAEFHPGLCYQILGRNGGGKSSLGLVLSGSIPHLVKGDYRGEVTYRDKPVGKSHLPWLSSVVFQDPYAYFSAHRFVDERRMFGEPEVNAEVQDLLDDLVPTVDPQIPLHLLSAGEQQRIAFVSAMTQDRPVTILDEPFAYMDRESYRKAISLLSIMPRDGKTVVVLDSSAQPHLLGSHDVPFRMTDGTLSRDEIADTIAEPPKPRKSRSKGRTLLEVSDVSFTYRRSKGLLFEGISCSLRPGEILGLEGPNGCGKTTLMLILAGLLRPTNGRIDVAGKRASARALRRTVRMAFQKPDSQLFCPTIRQELIFGLKNTGVSLPEQEERIAFARSLLPFPLERDPFSLSYGQKKLLTVVTTLCLKPDILLLDEPTASLDDIHERRVIDVILRFAESGGAAIIASHDDSLLRMHCDTVLRMKPDEVAPDD